MTDQLFTPLKSHPSTWQQEVAQLRDENTELALQGMIRNAQAAEAHEARLVAEADAEALRARVAELEAALCRIIGMTDKIAKAPMTADRWADRIEDLARAALQEGDNTPHGAPHSAKSVPRRD